MRAALLAAWLAGATTAVAALLLSLFRVRRLAGAAEDMGDAAWTTAAQALGARLGLRRPARLFVSPGVGTPMAGGVWRPAIFLPSSAREWSDERRDVVLAHEIAHLAGHDPLRHLAARLAVAFYWFHPLAWIAARQATVAREQACDEAVLALGTRPSAYARVLLELAESMGPSAAGLGALPMVDRSQMETRLMAILTDHARPASRRGALIPALGVALFALSVAAAQPAARAAAPDQPAPSPSIAVAAQVPSPAAFAPPVALSPVVPRQRPPVQLEAGTDSACRWDRQGTSFSGYSSTRDAGGRTIVMEQVGTSGADRVIQQTFGDMRVCMVAEGAGDRSTTGRPSEWLGRARRVVLETQRGGAVQRLEVAGQRTSWQVGGKERAFDAAAQQWRDRMLQALDTMWEVATLRGEVSSLRGEISSIRGEESSLRGEISSLRGEISSMHGRQSSVRGEESSLRGQISAIRGQLSSMRGAISSEQGNISSLNAGGYRSDDSRRTRDLIAGHEAAITRIEQEIRTYNAEAKIAAVERDIAALDADKKVAAIDAEIKAFDAPGKIAAIEQRITTLDVDGKIAAIERQITALDADRRGRALDERRDEELKRLEAAIAAIR